MSSPSGLPAESAGMSGDLPAAASPSALSRAWAVPDEPAPASVKAFADACLAHGYAPPVVPELKTITIGGAATGIGIESSSFRRGFVHEAVLEDMRKKLAANPIAIQLPLGKEGSFEGVVDLIAMEELRFGEDGNNLVRSPIAAERLQEAKAARERLLDALSSKSDEITALYLEGEEVPADLLRKVLRAACIAQELVPALCGASRRNIGVQPLLDAVVDFLPAPDEVPPAKAFTATPHIVLLHIGTNDMTSNADPSTTASQLDVLVGDLTKAAPDALIVVAKIVPLGYTSTTYNNYIAKIPGVVSAHTAKNEHVVMVDMSTLPTSDIRGSGNVHPTDQGYADMANLWYGAIKGYLP